MVDWAVQANFQFPKDENDVREEKEKKTVTSEKATTTPTQVTTERTAGHFGQQLQNSNALRK